MAEVRSNWEGRIINGIFPLRRFLSASDHSSVFLTESRTEGFLNAAIKLVPADPASSEVQLWQWKTAATFSHPHLMRLLDSGQCEIEGRQFLYVVMEYAEETLSQILPYRALSPDEVRELLVPTLDALAFLHRDNWVQGQLKPSNFLVVEDQLKLATDTIRPVSLSRAGSTWPSIYDPPESETGADSPAGDIWGLGLTVVEALTQYPPTWPAGRSEPPTLPANLPATFADTVRRCLSRNPDDRPTVAELQARTRPTDAAMESGPATPLRGEAAIPPRARQQAVVTPPVQQGPLTRPNVRQESVAPPRQPEPALRAGPQPSFGSSEFDLADEQKRGRWMPIAAGLLVIVLAVWGGSRLFHRQGETGRRSQESPLAQHSAQGQRAPEVQQTPEPQQSPEASPPPAPQRSARSAAQPPSAPGTSSPVGSPDRPTHQHGQSSVAASAPSALHEEIPQVPRSARETIHGRIKVGVLVRVDRSGRVVRDSLDSPGPSRYFNRLASQAARKWKFAPVEDQVSREWFLRFEFGRDGTTVHAVRARS